MRLFYTGMKSLDTVERHVRVSAEKQHIDCDLSVHANEVEGSDDDDDDDDQYINKEGENEQGVDAASISPTWGSMKVKLNLKMTRNMTLRNDLILSCFSLDGRYRPLLSSSFCNKSSSGKC